MINQIALAGLLHDIGKFAERAFPGEFEDIPNSDIFKYNHAAATYKFLEKYYKTTGEKWFSYAANHHNPSSNEPNEWIIAEADRLSSGMDRQTYAEEIKVGGSRKFQTLLKPITEFVDYNNEFEEKTGAFYFRLNNLELSREVIFPGYRDEYKNEETIRKNYKKLFDNFVQDFKELTSNNIEKKIETLYYVLQKYLWCIPSSVRKSDFPDISLFEHSKTTAAIATCLYKFHIAEDNNNIENIDAIKNRKLEKMLLFCGDIGGIQSFIYQISSKGAYSQLKGRSFYIQIINDIIADYFLEKTGLTITNLIYSSGGKFYLLLANTEEIKKILNDIIHEINKNLYEEFDGDIFLRTSYVPLSGNDLHLSTKTLVNKWDEVNKKLIISDRNKFDFLIKQNEQFKNIFQPKGTIDPYKCDVCAKSLTAEIKKCNNCEKFEKLGKELKKAKFLVLNEKKGVDSLGIFLNKKIELPENIKKINDGDRIYMLNTSEYSLFKQNSNYLKNQVKEKLGSLDLKRNTFGYKFYGGNRKFDATFDEIAERAKGGFNKLGILRMDVDNLGRVFGEGLKNYKVKITDEFNEKYNTKKNDNFYSISRLTTLSFQLNMFFSGYLNNIVENISSQKDKNQAAIVYSGGDDLFVVGTWNSVIEIANKIKNDFNDYTCNNPNFTLSAGIAITGGKFPIYKSAEYAGKYENNSKSNNIEYPKLKKQSITVFGHTVFWQEFDEYKLLKKKLVNIVERNKTNRALIGNLRKIYHEYLLSYKRLKTDVLSMEEIDKIIQHEKWIWRMVYNLKRYAERNKELIKDINDIQKILVSNHNTTNRSFIRNLPVALDWAELITRN